MKVLVTESSGEPGVFNTALTSPETPRLDVLSMDERWRSRFVLHPSQLPAP